MVGSVPQGLILGPILLNIFINDLFLFTMETQLCNFADDNTALLTLVATKLEGVMPRILEWVKINSIFANASKLQVVFLGIKGKHNACLDIEGSKVKSSKEVKLSWE